MSLCCLVTNRQYYSTFKKLGNCNERLKTHQIGQTNKVVIVNHKGQEKGH